jgi:hypothetical protein
MRENKDHIFSDDADWVEAKRYASRTPEGYATSNRDSAQRVAWFGRALCFMNHMQSHELVSVNVGLDVDYWILVRVCDMHIFGMEFVKRQ